MKETPAPKDRRSLRSEEVEGPCSRTSYTNRFPASRKPERDCEARFRFAPAFGTLLMASSLFGVGSDEINGAMPTELDPLAKRQCRPTGGVATASSFTVLVFL